MAKSHFIRLLGVEDGMARVQGPPPPRWLLDAAGPFVKGQIKGVVIYRSSTRINTLDDGKEREFALTGLAHQSIIAALEKQGLHPPERDEF